MNLLIRRFLAFLFDYISILLYGALLFCFVLLISKAPVSEIKMPNPFIGQLIGFLTLTLPVFLYFTFSELSRKKATFGKQFLGIKVTSDKNDKPVRIILRNVLKFLPWEIAHTGVHWLLFFSKEANTPGWIMFLLVIPQLIALFYVWSIIRSKGECSIYDRLTHTRIIMK